MVVWIRFFNLLKLCDAINLVWFLTFSLMILFLKGDLLSSDCFVLFEFFLSCI